MTFQAGESWNGNKGGRPTGSRNKRTEEIFLRLEERGDKDPADLLSEIVSNVQEPKETVCKAANFLLPYKYGKCGSIPAARYISEPVRLPRATTLEQANSNIALISEMKSLRHIDLDFADSLIADNRTIANNIIASEELKLKLQDHAGSAPEQRILIEGGSPRVTRHQYHHANSEWRQQPRRRTRCSSRAQRSRPNHRPSRKELRVATSRPGTGSTAMSGRTSHR
jgi:hypothetical protein